MKKAQPKAKAREKPAAEFRFPKHYRVLPRNERHLVRPGETELRNCKVRVTMYLDADILRFFKTRAERPGAPAYQTQINFMLREVFERASQGTELHEAATASGLLHNRAFIKAIAREVGNQLGDRRN